jgi:hypothetical protein
MLTPETKSPKFRKQDYFNVSPLGLYFSLDSAQYHSSILPPTVLLLAT